MKTGVTLCTVGTALFFGTAVQAATVNLRNHCERWEHIPASEALGSPPAALLFCQKDTRSWLSLRIECRVEETRMALFYKPGFDYDLPQDHENSQAETKTVTSEANNTSTATEPVADTVVETGPLDVEAEVVDVAVPGMASKEMVFFDFPSLGYTSVARYGADTGDWMFFEPEPLSPVFTNLIGGNFANISLMATGIVERLPLRGSGNALRPVVEACRLAKIAAEKAAKSATEN